MTGRGDAEDADARAWGRGLDIDQLQQDGAQDTDTMTDAANTPRTDAAQRFMATVEQATLDPAIAKMIGATGEVVLALVSPDAIRDALIEAEAEAAAPTPADPLDVERLARALRIVGVGLGVDPADAPAIAAEYNRLAAEADHD